MTKSSNWLLLPETRIIEYVNVVESGSVASALNTTAPDTALSLTDMWYDDEPKIGALKPTSETVTTTAVSEYLNRDISSVKTCEFTTYYFC